MNYQPDDSEPPQPLDMMIERWLDADPLPPYVDEPEPERGPPLSQAECDAARSVLATSQGPSDFVAATNALRVRCTSEDWFNRPHLKFLHDAFVLSRFADLMAVESVRLAAANEQWPDGYVKLSGTVHNIEVTSTHGGRKLGEEYRGMKTATHDPVSNWIARAKSLTRYLDEAISAKRKKRYGSACWLIVYLNINWPYILRAETEEAIRTIKARHAASFEAISVLWDQKVY